jgi:hypothetical protein
LYSYAEPAGCTMICVKSTAERVRPQAIADATAHAIPSRLASRMEAFERKPCLAVYAPGNLGNAGLLLRVSVGAWSRAYACAP